MIPAGDRDAARDAERRLAEQRTAGPVGCPSCGRACERLPHNSAHCDHCFRSFRVPPAGAHELTVSHGPSGPRGGCSCGWGGPPRYDLVAARGDHAEHVRDVTS